MKKVCSFQSCFIVCLLFLPLISWGQLRLPRLVSDGMVLQRDAEVKIWGWASAAEEVNIRFLNHTYQTAASDSGEWEVLLTDLPAGGPHRMQIMTEDTITLNNILVGDVWVCSGQSNMELPMRRVKPLYEEEIKNAAYPRIRYFEVPKRYDFNHLQEDPPYGQWQPVNPESVLNFSAAAYFFAQSLYEEYQVPIGLINSALGGSPVEAWMSAEALQAFPEHYQEAQRFKDASLIQQIEQADQQRRSAWYTQIQQQDQGYAQKPWYMPNLKDSGWAEMQTPGNWSDTQLGEVNGVVWFRKEIELPAAFLDKDVKLNLGRIVDADSVFINGQYVGSTGYQYPPRWYTVPGGLLREGKNTIAVRVINERGQGGFVPDKPYELTTESDTLDLKGPWKYRLGVAIDPLAPQTFIRWKPMGLFQGMISPLLNYRIKGVIWYQGESNADRPEEYAVLFPAMIRDWRNHWQQGDFPFLFVQLANYMEAQDHPQESNWAMLREAQRQTLALPNTGMAVAIDVGEWNDIHPLNKKAVGQRLALAARKVAYDEDVVYSGPSLEAVRRDGKRLVLDFEHAGGGLIAKHGELQGFAVADKDGNFVWADARIEGDQVIVWSKKVNHPVEVRYAWADNPERANLYNREGLPASPFRAVVEPRP